MKASLLLLGAVSALKIKSETKSHAQIQTKAEHKLALDAKHKAAAKHMTHIMQAGDQDDYIGRLFNTGLKFECTQYIENGNPNDWHIVRLTSEDGNSYNWENKAGVSWTLYPGDHDERGHPTGFHVGTDCPYYDYGYDWADVTYNDNGSLMSLSGPWGEIYNYVIDWTLADMKIDMPNVWQTGLNFECSSYIQNGNSNDWHFVTIANPSGDGETFEWTNRAGVTWSLAPVYDFTNYQRGGRRLTDFNVGTDCPYYDYDHHDAALDYNHAGSLNDIAGPWGEVYSHVIAFTPV